ncbi:MAG TPA: HDOD domain-containing protein [Burkholderiaceae bacterium]
MGHITPELGARLRSAIERMPAFPKSVQRILELTRDINCHPKDVVAVIEKDPVIAVKILKLLNSAHYSLPSKITSIGHSVVFLGMNTVKNLALNFSAHGILPAKNSAGFDMHHYLMHALLCANLTRQLAEQYADEVDANDAYLAGLLHNFGKVVFVQFMPEQYRDAIGLAERDGIPLHEAEVQVIGTDHARAGAMLIEHWQFPPALAACVAGHHEGAGDSPLGQCLHAADRIALHLLAEADGQDAAGGQANAPPREAPLAPRFNTDLDGLIAGLGNTNKMLEQAAMFCQGSH